MRIPANANRRRRRAACLDGAELFSNSYGIVLWEAHDHARGDEALHDRAANADGERIDHVRGATARPVVAEDIFAFPGRVHAHLIRQQRHAGEEVGAGDNGLQDRAKRMPVALRLYLFKVERLVTQAGSLPGVGGARPRAGNEVSTAERAVFRKIDAVLLRRRRRGDVDRNFADAFQIVGRRAFVEGVHAPPREFSIQRGFTVFFGVHVDRVLIGAVFFALKPRKFQIFRLILRDKPAATGRRGAGFASERIDIPVRYRFVQAGLNDARAVIQNACEGIEHFAGGGKRFYVGRGLKEVRRGGKRVPFGADGGMRFYRSFGLRLALGGPVRRAFWRDAGRNPLQLFAGRGELGGEGERNRGGARAAAGEGVKNVRQALPSCSLALPA